MPIFKREETSLLNQSMAALISSVYLFEKVEESLKFYKFVNFCASK